MVLCSEYRKIPQITNSVCRLAQYVVHNFVCVCVEKNQIPQIHDEIPTLSRKSSLGIHVSFKI